MAVLDGGGRRSRWRESTAVVPSPGVRNGPSSSLCSDAQSLFFSSPCMLSLSLLCLPQKLLFLFRFLLCCCWWQLLLATLLVTRQNDGGAASNGGGRETRERDELLFLSPVLLFFCSFLLFSRQLKSSPLCSSTLFSKQSLFLSQTIPCFLLSIRFSSSSSFPKSFAPSGFFFFSLLLPHFCSLLPSFLQKQFLLLCLPTSFLSIPLSIYSQRERE